MKSESKVPDRPWFIKSKGQILENLFQGEDKYTADLNVIYFTEAKIKIIVALRKFNLGYLADDINPAKITDEAYRAKIQSIMSVMIDESESNDLSSRLFNSVIEMRLK